MQFFETGSMLTDGGIVVALRVITLLLVFSSLLLTGCTPVVQEPVDTAAPVQPAAQQPSANQFPPTQFLRDNGLPISTDYELDLVLRLPTKQVLVRTTPFSVFFVGEPDGTDFRPVCGSANGCEYVGFRDGRLVFLTHGGEGGRWHFPEEVVYHIASGTFESRPIFLNIFEPSKFGYKSMQGEPLAELEALTATENGLQVVTKDLRDVLAADTIFPWTEVRYRISDHTLHIRFFRTKLAESFEQAISNSLVERVEVTPLTERTSVGLVLYLKNTVTKYRVDIADGDGPRFSVREFLFKEE